jgi:cellulose synthase/poly-beta-1,6-N-acetylglucosamine synthase-like glycosyltransferase
MTDATLVPQETGQINMALEQVFPLTTLAIFTFNQSDKILEAVEAALSQDYKNLEIIISDDCSTDETFNVCQAFLSEHDTGRNIRLRQTRQNNGTFAHVLDVVREAAGELFIVAAGDDISKPNRVSRIVEEWKKKRFIALYSAYDYIDDYGQLISKNVEHEFSNRVQWVFRGYKPAKYVTGRVLNIAGCSSAYDCAFLQSLPMPSEKIFSDDALLTYLINIQGGDIRRLPDSLIYYRKSNNSITEIKDADSLGMFIKSEERLCAFAQSNYSMYSYLRHLIVNQEVPNIENVDEKLKGLQQYSEYVSTFWDLNIAQRLLFALRHPAMDRMSFFLPRLFGLHVFLYAKKLAQTRRSKT